MVSSGFIPCSLYLGVEETKCFFPLFPSVNIQNCGESRCNRVLTCSISDRQGPSLNYYYMSATIPLPEREELNIFQVNIFRLNVREINNCLEDMFRINIYWPLILLSLLCSASFNYPSICEILLRVFNFQINTKPDLRSKFVSIFFKEIEINILLKAEKKKKKFYR